MIQTITVDQMREVDRLMVEDMGIELIQMMENAGRCLAADDLLLGAYALVIWRMDAAEVCYVVAREVSSGRLA